MKINDITSRISSSVHGTDPTAELFLFGSRARGDNRPDSPAFVGACLSADRFFTNKQDEPG